MGPVSTVKKWFSRRKEKPKPKKVWVDDSPPRTYVVALNKQRFDVWCHNTGTSPYGKDINYVPTNNPHHYGMRGVILRPEDKLVVLEDADFGHGWDELRLNILVCSENKIDIFTEPQVRT